MGPTSGLGSGPIEQLVPDFLEALQLESLVCKYLFGHGICAFVTLFVVYTKLRYLLCVHLLRFLSEYIAFICNKLSITKGSSGTKK